MFLTLTLKEKGHNVKNLIQFLVYMSLEVYLNTRSGQLRTLSVFLGFGTTYLVYLPPRRGFEILGWCPVGPVLPNGEKVPL